jgi:biopolymer transport protein ExbB
MELIKDFIDYFIFGILGLMSLLSITYAIERFWYYKIVDVKKFETEEELETSLTKNLTALSIISSNAPYIGLLGTVVGIMITFYDMGKAGNLETNTILIGLSLALKATAFGLVVAIPSLIIYSMCLRKCDVLIAKWKSKR